MEVRDDGHGFDPGRDAGAGLRGMRERALLVGAGLAVESRHGRGTAVRLTLGRGAAR
jgi:two-component system sensor histidine kinase UhpB